MVINEPGNFIFRKTAQSEYALCAIYVRVVRTLPHYKDDEAQHDVFVFNAFLCV